MPKKVRSVRVPEAIEDIDLSSIVKECAAHLRDLETALLLKNQGNREAAEALIRTRQAELGRRIGKLVFEARVRTNERRRQAEGEGVSSPI